jgi:hypothetical protein
MTVQQGVLAPVPAQARYLTFMLNAGADPRRTLNALAAIADGVTCVVGIGRSTVSACGSDIASCIY